MSRAAALLGLLPLACVEIDPSYAIVDGSSTAAATSDDSATTEAAASSGGSDDGSTGAAIEHNLAFVSSATVAGDFGGLAVADTLCNDLAQAAGLPGTYVAYLSDGTDGALARIGSASGWVRTDGQVFARDRNDLVSANVAYPLLLTETGAIVDGHGAGLVYTGSEPNGVSAPETCLQWQSAVAEESGRSGFSDGGGGLWVSIVLLSCSASAHVYCLGTDLDAPVEVPPAPADARLAFISNATLAPDAGRDAADAICASEASAAGRSGTFLALMAVPGEGIWDRHATDGGPWHRADDVLVFPTDVSLPQQSTLATAPVMLDASGQLTGNPQFWSGVGSPGEIATADSTCNGWTDPAYPRHPTGWSVYATWLTGLAESPCNDVSRGVVCLEQ